MEKHEMVCIVCPVGCHLEVTKDDNAATGYIVTGATCKRGEVYGVKELTNPTRMLTSTVKIKGALVRRLPVRTSTAIPKGKIFECMAEINKIEVNAPVKCGSIIIENVLNTGVNIIASRSMDRVD
jgi:CxxC motif-containing protein